MAVAFPELELEAVGMGFARDLGRTSEFDVVVISQDRCGGLKLMRWIDAVCKEQPCAKCAEHDFSRWIVFTIYVHDVLTGD